MAPISIQRIVDSSAQSEISRFLFQDSQGTFGGKKGCQSFWLAVILMDFFLLSSALIEDVATSLVITV